MATSSVTSVFEGVDPLWLAMNRFRQRRFEETDELCSEILARRERVDLAAWLLKTRALTQSAWVDDTEMEEDGVAEVLMDEDSIASAPRPGTSLARPMTGRAGSGPDASTRPVTGSARPLTGFARPGTGSRPVTGASVDHAFMGTRPGTSRPMTALGRQVRLGTASLAARSGGPFINADRLDLARYAKQPALAKALCEYILFVDGNPRKAMELCAKATVAADYSDWWWKQQLGKCYYQLGLLDDAESQFLSAIRDTPMITSYLGLCKLFIKRDVPASALEWYARGQKLYPGDVPLLLGSARIYDMLNKSDEAVALYKQVLYFEASNVEAIASLASYHFYTDQPEVALRYYRRLLQLGLNNAELWCNLGLCCLYASQYDMTLSCFSRALAMADDSNSADIWYNLGHLAIGIGEQGLAYQCFKVAVSVDGTHADSFTNLGILELRKGDVDQARSNFQNAQRLAPFSYEPFYNEALLSFRLGDFQDAYRLVCKALEAYPEHSDSLELQSKLRETFTML